MKKPLFFLIILTTLTNVSYASFPVLLENKTANKIPIGEILGPLAGLTILFIAFYILRRFFRKGNTVRKWMWENPWKIIGALALLFVILFAIALLSLGSGMGG